MSLPTLIGNLVQLGIRLEANSGKVRFSPQSSVTPRLTQQVRVHKDDLLALLAANSVDPVLRELIYDGMRERVNLAHQHGQIDWSRLDRIEKRIDASQTLSELLKEVANYGNEVDSQNNTG
jgi:hypothetical protein